jgi:hypothetical protein
METSREVVKVSEQKIEQFWRDAAADDVAEIVKAGNAKEARFRDELKDHWISGSNSFLAGGTVSHRDVIIWISKTTIRWKLCQVYDPPAWFVNKPDPGEGFRLLGKFPHEVITGTDDYWSTAKAKWMPIVKLTTNKQPEKTWFRRRIETNSPEIPDSCKEAPTPNSSHLGQIIEVRNYEDADWQRAELEAVFPHTEFAYVARVEKNTRDFPLSWRFGRLVQADCNSSETPNSSRSREDIPSGWRLLGKDEERLAGDAYWSLGCKEWIIIGDDLVKYANELSKWHVIRQVGLTGYFLTDGCTYCLPNHVEIRITAKGLEVV